MNCSRARIVSFSNNVALLGSVNLELPWLEHASFTFWPVKKTIRTKAFSKVSDALQNTPETS